MPRRKLTPEEKAAKQEAKETAKNQEIQNKSDDAIVKALKEKIAELEKPTELRVPTEQRFTGLSLAESRAQAQKEMLDNRRIQKQQGTFKAVQGNKDEFHSFPEWEKNLFHVRLTMRPPENIRGKNFVTEGGKTFEKTELPTKIWKGNKIQFERMEKHNAFKSYQGVTILHDPRL